MTPVGQWFAVAPGHDLEHWMRQQARIHGVRHPRIVHYAASEDDCLLYSVPFPCDIWGWSGQPRIIDLPEYVLAGCR
jgi:hypothetical protein